MGGYKGFESEKTTSSICVGLSDLRKQVSCNLPKETLEHLKKLTSHIDDPENQLNSEYVKGVMPDKYTFKGEDIEIDKNIVSKSMLLYFNHPGEGINEDYYYLSTVLFGASIDEAEILNEQAGDIMPVRGALNTNIEDYIYFLNCVEQGYVIIEGIHYNFKNSNKHWELTGPNGKPITFTDMNVNFDPNAILAIGHYLKGKGIVTYDQSNGFKRPAHINKHQMFVQSYPGSSDSTVSHEGLHIHFDNNLLFRQEIVEKFIKKLSTHEKEAILYHFSKGGFYDVVDNGATHTLIVDELLAGSQTFVGEKIIDLDLTVSNYVAEYSWGGKGFWNIKQNLGDFKSKEEMIAHFFSPQKIIENKNIPEIR